MRLERQCLTCCAVPMDTARLAGAQKEHCMTSFISHISSWQRERERERERKSEREREGETDREGKRLDDLVHILLISPTHLT